MNKNKLLWALAMFVCVIVLRMEGMHFWEVVALIVLIESIVMQMKGLKP